MSEAIGRALWVIPGGRIAFPSTGPEPAMTSRDEVRLLNTGAETVRVELTIVYGDADPVGPHCVDVASRRVRSVRINDLIDPLPVPLETDYAIVVRASAPIVVQFTRLDSSAASGAIMGTVAWPQ